MNDRFACQLAGHVAGVFRMGRIGSNLLDGFDIVSGVVKDLSEIRGVKATLLDLSR